MSSPQALADILVEVTQTEYARFVAHWLTHASELNFAPALVGDPVVDALVAAAASHVAFTRNAPVPAWTNEPNRFLPTLWYVGPDGLFPNALVHSPLSFTLHGVLIEEDSLVSV